MAGRAHSPPRPIEQTIRAMSNEMRWPRRSLCDWGYRALSWWCQTGVEMSDRSL